MAHLTDNFTFESQLSPRVRQAIAAALEQGWADPKKLSQASHRALDLRTSAIEEFASTLNISPAAVEITGEPHLIHHLAIQGFLRNDSHLHTSAVDVGKIRAIARSHSGAHSLMPVSPLGDIEPPEGTTVGDVLSLQVENGETGYKQNLDLWRHLPAHIALDATRTTPRANLVDGFSIASFDAQAWDGPSGLAFLIVADGDHYRYPFAHIAPIRTPGSYSLPLLIGATVALAEYLQVEKSLTALRNQLADNLRTLDGTTVVGAGSEDSRYLSFLVEGYSSEEVLRALLKAGLSVDAGSACSPEDLTPSHVIAALGLPTTGHLRATIHPTMTNEDVERLTRELTLVLQKLSS